MTLIILGLIGLLGNFVVCTAFLISGHAHAKERMFLMNAALSGSASEFAVRQQASAPAEPDERTLLEDMYPEGL